MRGRTCARFGLIALTACPVAPVAPVAIVACDRIAGQARDAYRYRQPPALSDGWTTASLDDQKIDRARIEQMTGAIRREADWNIHAVLIEYDGRLVYEEYFAGEDQRWGEPLGRVAFDLETKHDLRSVTKSVVSALVGAAAHAGKIRSLDAPVVEYFPEYADLQTPERRRITLRHVLGMTAGLEWNEEVSYADPRNSEIVMTRSAEPLRYVLSRPIVSEPGTTWNYSGGLTQLLAAVVQRSTGTPLREYAKTVLFAPLGITDVDWLGDLAGLPSAASGLRLRPRDLAKFGSLYLHQGRWRSQQVLPADWVEQSTRRRLTIGGERSDGYAYQWWHACVPAGSGVVEARMAAGNGSQRIYVLPTLNAVVTMLAGRYNDFTREPTRRILTEYIVPSIPARASGRCPNDDSR